MVLGETGRPRAVCVLVRPLAMALLAFLATSPGLRAQTQQAVLLPPAPSFGDLFGKSVALDGGVAAVGSSGANSSAGAVHVFRKTGAAWLPEAVLTDAAGTPQELFGFSVANDAGRILVGAPDPVFPFINPIGTGSAQVFAHAAGNWSFEADLVPLAAQNADQVGASVALDGAVAILGAPGDQTVGPGDSSGGVGAAYVFREVAGIWSEEQRLAAPDGLPGDIFGQAVAVEGTTAIVGAPDVDVGPAVDAGAVYVFEFDGLGWVFQQELTPTGLTAGDSFGSSLALSGPVLAVGAPSSDLAGTDAGAVWVFRKVGAVWVLETTLLASDAAASATFGEAVAADGGVIIAGAPGHLGGAGTAYVFRDTGGGIWNQEGTLVAVGALTAGSSVSVVGERVLVGAPLSDAGPILFAGSAYVYLTFDDCNGNEIDDAIDIAGITSADCNLNGIPDECEADCNTNGIADACDITAGVSLDCNLNGIPDECETDCNANGIPDDCDIGLGGSLDCNLNGIPDECEPDCNANGIPDSCDITTGVSLDCNLNGIPDSCDIASGVSQDCNTNGIPDSCDITAGVSLDCNLNGIPDECETDCNANGIPDSCDITAGVSLDCNLNGIPDECDLAAGTSADCNLNGIPDECDIAAGTSADVNSNGLPDECEGQWNDLGNGLAGSLGLVPQLAGSGPQTDGAPVTLSLVGAVPASTAGLVVGFTAVNLPFKGGTLVPSPVLIVAGLPTGAGTLVLASTWPLGLPPGFSVFYQYWIADAAGPMGFSASNGLQSVTP